MRVVWLFFGLRDKAFEPLPAGTTATIHLCIPASKGLLVPANRQPWSPNGNAPSQVKPVGILASTGLRYGYN